jgi:hypothetical protein
MYDTMNGVSPELVPGYKVSPALALFFMLFIIFGGFFITNLFIGVVIASFNRECTKLGNDFMLTEKQKEWITTKILLFKVAPKLV